MGLFDRFRRKDKKPKAENWTLVSGYPAWFAGGLSSSGEPVSPTTAMQLTAVYGCVKILSEAIAELPLHTYKTTEDGGKVKAFRHPLYNILHDEPNPEMTSFAFRETLMSHLCLWGNAYAQIIRNGRGEVMGLYPLLPNKMRVLRDDRNRIVYVYNRTEGEAAPGEAETVTFASEDILHIPGLGFDGLIGYSPLSMARNAIGASIASDSYADRFFGNAAMPSGVLEYPGVLKDPQKISERWGGSFSGAVNAGKTPVLEEGMTYKPISISPQDAQVLETRKFNINEIARIFRVPPHMLADLEKSSFSNIEQQSLEFVKYTIAPWVARIEQGLKKSLLRPDEKAEGYFFSFNLEGLLRGDYNSRMNGYAIARQNGWMSANDIRELENMNRIPAEEGGDLYLVNGNMLPLAQAGAAYGNPAETTTEEGGDTADDKVLEMERPKRSGRT